VLRVKDGCLPLILLNYFVKADVLAACFSVQEQMVQGHINGEQAVVLALQRNGMPMIE
jgi:hypothetical protein